MTNFRNKKYRQGQAAILVTLSLVASLGMIGLVVDVGWAYWRKQACKTAADAAAIAAALTVSNKVTSAHDCGVVAGVTCQSATACPANPSYPPATNIDNGCLYAQENGFRHTGNQTVTIEAHDTGVSSGTSTNPAYWVRVKVTENIPQTFSAVLRHPWATVAAESVTGVFLRPANACIYSLSPTSSDYGIKVNGNVTINSGCGIFDNATASGVAFTSAGSAKVTASSIRVVGGYNLNGGTNVNPLPTTNVTPTTDPLADVIAPAVPTGQCDFSSITESSVIPYKPDPTYVICGGGFSMNGNTTLNLKQGTYIIKGGAVDWRNGTLRADGPVTFYLTGGVSSVNVNGNMDISLDAPTSGQLKGMLFFQDRAQAIPLVNFNGGSKLLLNGSVYFPTSEVNYSGGSSTTNNYTALIGWRITFVGDAYFRADIGGQHNGLGSPIVHFVF